MIKINKEECTSCGFCIRSMPEVFGFDEYGWAFVKNQDNNYDFEKLQYVMKKCPSSCITYWK
ncbi:MAG TPA: ferredoxin [Spirochaetota bacterium]|nr:ferredoxin [Spirochaetota bacterium]HOM38768.1 ferredoxin [Spirochaetota bacterium]HPQ49566.1 ferredoxin [Spirochaetota bacterium]